MIDDPIKASRGGWVFETSQLQITINNKGIGDLRELYDCLSPTYQGHCTTPLLVNWKTKCIISNESEDIVPMLPLLLKAKQPQQKSHQHYQHDYPYLFVISIKS